MKNTFQIMMLIIRIRIKFPQMTLNCIKLISLMRLLNNKDQNQSIDEDNFNNQSNESEQLDKMKQLNNLMKHQMKMLKTLKVPKRMIVTDSPLILVKTHISYLLKIELKSSMTIVKEKTCQEYTI